MPFMVAGTWERETFSLQRTHQSSGRETFQMPNLVMGEARVAWTPLVSPLGVQEVNLSGARRPEAATKPGRGRDVPLPSSPSSAPRRKRA